MFKKLLLLGGCTALCLVAMDPKPELPKKTDQQIITVRRRLAGAGAHFGYKKIPTYLTTTIKELSEEMAPVMCQNTLPTIYAVYKIWWPALYGWKLGWAEKKSEPLDGNRKVSEVIKEYNTILFQVSLF